MYLTLEELKEKIELAKSDDLSFEDAVTLSVEDYIGILDTLAQNPRTPVYILIQFANHENTWVRQSVACNPNLPVSAIELLANDSDVTVRQAIARGLNTPGSVLQQLSKDKYLYIRLTVAGNANTPIYVLERLILDDEVEVGEVARKYLMKKAGSAKRDFNLKPVL